MGKMKSPNYPAIGLTQAIELIRVLWEKEKRTPVTADVAVKAIGYASLNGASLTRLSALKKYGLLESEGKKVRISQLAIRILHEIAGSEAHQLAIREAAFKPELFKELAASHADGSDTGIRSHLMVDKDFSEAGAQNFIAAFRDTMRLVNQSDSGYSSDKKDEEDSAMAGTAPARETTPRAIIPDTLDQVRPQVPQRPTVHSWVLSKDVSVELRIAGDLRTKAEAERLRQYVDLTVGALIAEEE